MYRKNLSGEKINNWTVLHVDEKTLEAKNIKWVCKCDCGKIYSILGCHLKSGASSKCITCKYQGPKKKFPSKLWWQIKWGAKTRDHEFNLTKEYLLNLIKKQDYKCKITGVKIGFANTNIGHHYGECTASLDRIDSSKGYIEGNVQWVHKDINRMKWKFSQKEFLMICKLICEYNKEELLTLDTKDYYPDSNRFKKDKNNTYEKPEITVVKEYIDITNKNLYQKEYDKANPKLR